MKFLAAIATVAVAVPFAALAQTLPPVVSMEAVPEPMAPAAPAVATTLSPADGPLNIDAYPAAQRDAIWERYARKNSLSVNILYPLSGMIMTTVVSGFTQSFGGESMGALSLPVEYELCVNRGFSLFGVVQPELAMGDGESQFSLALGAGARAYLSGNAPQGFWMGLHASSVLPAKAVTARFEVGVNGIFANNLTVSFGGGLGVTYASDTTNFLTDKPLPWFPAAGLRFSIGYVF